MGKEVLNFDKDTGKFKIQVDKIKSRLLSFQKDGKQSYFDYEDGKWVFCGDLEVDESARIFFEFFSGYMEKYFDIKRYKEDQVLLHDKD